MTKLKIIIISVFSVLFAVSISINITLLIENSRKNKELKQLGSAYQSLSASFSDISRQKTYSISLAPNIVNKNTAAFGKVQNVTLQYFFSMDGNSIELLPDSVKKIVDKKGAVK